MDARRIGTQRNLVEGHVDGHGKQAFLAAIQAEHGPAPQRFISSRLRHALTDVPDLVQEVYLRMLRVPHPETIRSPQAYLLTVAKHVLFEHRARRSPMDGAVNIVELLQELEATPESGPEAQALSAERARELNRVLSQLPSKARAALILHRLEGLTLEQIGARLGVSRSMAKKYLVKALTYCRQAAVFE